MALKYEKPVPMWMGLRLTKRTTPDFILPFFGFTKPPVPIESLAALLEIVIDYVDTQDFSGELRVDSSNRATIMLRKRDARVRQRFTIAHEIGHLLLHENITHHRDEHFSPLTQVEREANAFAADLLMPAWMIHPSSDIERGRADRLASLFDVSIVAMEYRLQRLGIQPW